MRRCKHVIYRLVFLNTMYTVEGIPQLVLLHFSFSSRSGSEREDNTSDRSGSFDEMMGLEEEYETVDKVNNDQAFS